MTTEKNLNEPNDADETQALPGEPDDRAAATADATQVVESGSAAGRGATASTNDDLADELFRPAPTQALPPGSPLRRTPSPTPSRTRRSTRTRRPRDPRRPRRPRSRHPRSTRPHSGTPRRSRTPSAPGPGRGGEDPRHRGLRVGTVVGLHHRRGRRGHPRPGARRDIRPRSRAHRTAERRGPGARGRFDDLQQPPQRPRTGQALSAELTRQRSKR
ncbi:hypothetical protein NKG05_04680 [Oerskovia sp. M15]